MGETGEERDGERDRAAGGRRVGEAPSGSVEDPGNRSGEARPGEVGYRSPTGGTLDRAVELVRFLRVHCPWDAEQTARSLIPHLLEESHEVVDAIRDDDPEALEGELGDLLLNVAFQIVVGEEAGRFTPESVTRTLEAKMRRRHPHVYGDGERLGWEELKARERGASGSPTDAAFDGSRGTENEAGTGAGQGPGDAGRGGERAPGVLDGLARGLDPLTRAHRMQERVAGVGFDWSDFRGAWGKVAEEVQEVREALEGGDDGEVEDELGDLLFAMVNLTRLAGHHPAEALDRANRKFRRRFRALERRARERGVVLGEASLEDLDVLWDEVKEEEGGATG